MISESLPLQYIQRPSGNPVPVVYCKTEIIVSKTSWFSGFEVHAIPAEQRKVCQSEGATTSTLSKRRKTELPQLIIPATTSFYSLIELGLCDKHDFRNYPQKFDNPELNMTPVDPDAPRKWTAAEIDFSRALNKKK